MALSSDVTDPSPFITSALQMWQEGELKDNNFDRWNYWADALDDLDRAKEIITREMKKIEE